MFLTHMYYQLGGLQKFRNIVRRRRLSLFARFNSEVPAASFSL